jgi:tetratricopeptide (TPR) repeat protein
VNIDWRRLRHAGVIWLVLALAGTVAESVRSGIADETIDLRSTIQAKASGDPLGGGLALLGNFRQLGADLMWVKAYHDWSKKDLRTLRKTLGRVATLNPYATRFWLNGARMLAYDATAWRMARDDSLDERAVQGIKREQLAEALDYLTRGKRMLPDRWELEVEAAVLKLNLGADAEGALSIFESLENRSGLPFYVGRVRGELLIKLGRSEDALNWLRKFEKTLPVDDPEARKEVVIARILVLERRK